MPPSKATALSSDSVAYRKIHYIASLQISVLPTTQALFGVEKSLLQRTAETQGLTFGAVNGKLRLGSVEYFYTGEQTAHGEMPCSAQILDDNWVGPPSCVGQPPLQKVGILAWIGGSTGTGDGWSRWRPPTA